MAKGKPIKTIIKLQIAGGRANPAPPVGPALGQHGLNIQEFCTKFNEATKDRMGEITPAEITVYEDRTFTFVLKTPPAAELLKKAAKVDKGSANPLKSVGTVTRDQVRTIAEAKLVDLTASSVEQAMHTVEGTARSMGITVKD